MKHYFIPGRIPDASLIELSAVLQREDPRSTINSVSKEVFIIDTDSSISPELFNQLGGFIKYGELFAEDIPSDVLESTITEYIEAHITDPDKRITFGISEYTLSQKPSNGNRNRKAFANQKRGLSIKKGLVGQSYSARFVSPQKNELALSSVTVEKNHLTQGHGFEFVILRDEETYSLGITRAVQQFEEFSHRDWDRPHRDMEVGILPPKIARMMVNLSGTKKDGALLDPFCGLGTVLQEALLLGYTNAYGSDLEQKQIDATKENIEWLVHQSSSHMDSGSLSSLGMTLKQCDARSISQCFPKTLFDTIVTEPYLGPIMNAQSTRVDNKTLQSLCTLYIEAFHEWKKVLKKNARVVVVFPFWIFQDKKIFLPCTGEIYKLGYKNVTIPQKLSALLTEKTDRGSILIAREGQHVGRELFVFSV